jgi:hypothetical protein|tara:strand:- start:215 stop:436 length:222 start_codon:yes stop_codon:yes gene_type:complete
MHRIIFFSFEGQGFEFRSLVGSIAKGLLIRKPAGAPMVIFALLNLKLDWAGLCDSWFRHVIVFLSLNFGQILE